jgi:Cu2+-exporting ATPase
MVGDGINDSAALAQAHLSIAMGGGSGIAIDASMVTILSADLTRIPLTIALSRKTVRTIRENLFWAFIYNLIAVPIAAGALYPLWGFLLNPMIASAAMAMSSVSVVSNSLRLKRQNLDNDNIIHSNNTTIMEKDFKVEGMMCNHCRMHVEKALNSVEGITATVTLEPPVAHVEGGNIDIARLQKAIIDSDGDYRLSPLD